MAKIFIHERGIRTDKETILKKGKERKIIGLPFLVSGLSSLPAFSRVKNTPLPYMGRDKIKEPGPNGSAICSKNFFSFLFGFQKKKKKERKKERKGKERKENQKGFSPTRRGREVAEFKRVPSHNILISYR